MVLNRILPRTGTLCRNFSTTKVARSDHDTRGVIGSNLPFQIKNRYRLTAVFILFFGSGLSLPFLMVRRLLLNKNS